MNLKMIGSSQLAVDHRGSDRNGPIIRGSSPVNEEVYSVSKIRRINKAHQIQITVGQSGPALRSKQLAEITQSFTADISQGGYSQ